MKLTMIDFTFLFDDKFQKRLQDPDYADPDPELLVQIRKIISDLDGSGSIQHCSVDTFPVFLFDEQNYLILLLFSFMLDRCGSFLLFKLS